MIYKVPKSQKESGRMTITISQTLACFWLPAGTLSLSEFFSVGSWGQAFRGICPSYPSLVPPISTPPRFGATHDQLIELLKML